MSVEEISWRKAFGYALRYVVYIIVWFIIGSLIIFAGAAMILSSTSYEPPYYTRTFNPGALVGGIILIFIGAIIELLGGMAAYFKIMSRLISEATYRPSPPPPER